MSAERHPVTAKLWEWFEHDERALSHSPELRAAIQARIEDLDRELHYFDRQIVTKAGKVTMRRLNASTDAKPIVLPLLSEPVLSPAEKAALAELYADPAFWDWFITQPEPREDD